MRDYFLLNLELINIFRFQLLKDLLTVVDKCKATASKLSLKRDFKHFPNISRRRVALLDFMESDHG